MRMLWSGTLGFGLVQVPIRLYKATRRRRVRFRLLHERDHAPVQYQKMCSEEQEPISDDEIVRGYEMDDEWVTITDEELERASPALTRSIEIRDFADLHEIDPIFFRKPYYLAPGEGGEELYVMLREAIRRSGKVGLAEFVLMHREHLGVIRVHGDALVVETLHYPEELIDADELDLPAETRLREGEIRMAVELIRNLSEPFDPSRYRNEYRAEVLDMIRDKAEGKLPPEAERPPAPEPTPVIDLTRRLEESIRQFGDEGRRTA